MSSDLPRELADASKQASSFKTGDEFEKYKIHCPVCGSSAMSFNCSAELVCNTCGHSDTGSYT